MDEVEETEQVSVENTVKALGLMVDRANQVAPHGDNFDKQIASFIALRDALVRCFPIVEGTSESSAGSNSVLFALNAETQEWSRHGFTGKDWQHWQVYGFSPQSAGEWRTIGVDIEKALFFRDSGLHAKMYVKWASLHDLGELNDPVTQNMMFHLVGVVRSMKEVTVAGAHRWVERNINLWDMPKWLKAGYTPAKAQAAIEAGMSVEDLAGVDDVLVTGASWAKVQKAMAKYGWTFTSSKQSNWSISVDWEKGDVHMTVNFTHGGRISSFYMWTCDSSGQRVRDWLPNYGYRGVKNFLALVKDESEGRIVGGRR